MEKTSKHRYYKLLIFSLVLLFNPNFNVVDLLPDFIAWFILAKIFERAADSAPYFEEARLNFIRLGWLNLLKIPALFLIIFVKSKDTIDNNIYALVSFSFAIFEIILATQAAKNIFTALFYLGERTDAASLIEPYSVSQRRKRKASPEDLKNFTYLFVIAKTSLYVIPDFFLLTGVSEKGFVITGSKYYPFVLLFSILIGTVIGVIWLLSIKKYALKIHSEDKFYASLDSIAGENGYANIERKTKLRALLTTPTLMMVAAFFSMELVFENWNSINILPHFIYGIALTLMCYSFKKHSRPQRIALFWGAVYSVVSLIGYIFTVDFLTKYEYSDLIKNTSAQKVYNTVQIFGAIEFVFLVLFLVFIAKAFNAYITEHTGVSPSSERYQRLEIEFHRSLKIKNYVMMSLGILAGLAKCANVFLNSDVQVLFSETDTITASALPWFGIIVTFTSVAYIAFTFFYMSTLKEEVNMKYQSI